MTTGAYTEEQILNMSDEDIMKMGQAPDLAEASASADPVTPPVTEEPASAPVVEPEPAEEPEPVDEPEPGQEGKPAPAIDTTSTDKPAAEAPKKEAPKAEAEKPAPVEVDYKAGYEKIMAPFKANGKDIKLDSPDDVIKLMQMGANYTKKMQALQPNLKLLKMLENQGLLDEGKLNYLIDLGKGNPGAIQKLVKDSGIDPLEFDASKDPGYVPGNHSVSEQELQFNSVLDEVTSTQEGADIVVAIDKQWDDASKQALYKEPAILQHLANQKQIGVFDQIVAEVERQRVLGNLTNMPFINAYNMVGQHLAQSGLLKGQTPASTVVATSAPAKAAAVVNSDKARAASPTKSAPAKVKQELNPLAMSDEEFMKMMNVNI